MEEPLILSLFESCGDPADLCLHQEKFWGQS